MPPALYVAWNNRCGLTLGAYTVGRLECRRTRYRHVRDRGTRLLVLDSRASHNPPPRDWSRLCSLCESPCNRYRKKPRRLREEYLESFHNDALRCATVHIRTWSVVVVNRPAKPGLFFYRRWVPEVTGGRLNVAAAAARHMVRLAGRLHQTGRDGHLCRLNGDEYHHRVWTREGRV